MPFLQISFLLLYMCPTVPVMRSCKTFHMLLLQCMKHINPCITSSILLSQLATNFILAFFGMFSTSQSFCHCEHGQVQHTLAESQLSLVASTSWAYCFQSECLNDALSSSPHKSSSPAASISRPAVSMLCFATEETSVHGFG